jgi:hypothetical protein
MFPNLIINQRGMGLIAAVFIIVVVGMFGVLIARYTTISSVSSAEDYVWAQALYSAESTMRLNILSRDNGGGLGKATVKPTNFQGFDFRDDPISGDKRVSGDFDVKPANEPATIRVQAKYGTGVSRTVEVRYLLE